MGLLWLLVTSAIGAAPGPQSLAALIRDGNRDAVLAAITSPDIDVDAREPDGSTALLWATYKVDHEVVRALLKRGAKANLSNDFGSSPLIEAVKLGDVDLTRMLLEAHADANSPNQDGQTALMLASSIGSRRIAEMLIAQGANINAVEGFRGQTALMWAAAEDHPDVVELLLAHGAQVKRRANADDWPRQMTSEPRAQFRPTGGFTALLYATRSGCYRCAVALVKAGADVNQPNPDGITPLINALDARGFDTAMFLLDKGANPGAWDMFGRTPLYCAIDVNSWIPRGAGGPSGFAGYAGATQLQASNKSTALDVATRLLNMGVDPNHELTRMRPNGNGRGRFEDYMLRGGATPLMAAAVGFDGLAIKLLLAHGAEVNEPNDFLITPLMAASSMSGAVHSLVEPPERADVQTAALGAIDALLDGGADVNARVTGSHTRTTKITAYIQGRDHEGQTALFAAAESGWDQVTRHLVERGADPTVRDTDGKTAFDYAKSPRPAGTRVQAAGAARVAAGHAATVAYLESLAAKSPPSVSTTVARP